MKNRVKKTTVEAPSEGVFNASVRKAEESTGVIHRSVNDAVDELSDVLSEDHRARLWLGNLLKDSACLRKAIAVVFFSVVLGKGA